MLFQNALYGQNQIPSSGLDETIFGYLVDLDLL